MFEGGWDFLVCCFSGHLLALTVAAGTAAASAAASAAALVCTTAFAVVTTMAAAEAAAEAAVEAAAGKPSKAIWNSKPKSPTPVRTLPQLYFYLITTCDNTQYFSKFVYVKILKSRVIDDGGVNTPVDPKYYSLSTEHQKCFKI